MTGVGRHSLGEALAMRLAKTEASSLICIDVANNPRLEEDPRYRYLKINLNPLERVGRTAAFSGEFIDQLQAAVNTLGTDHVSTLVQCAGTYAAGAFIDHTQVVRDRLIGVNFLGRVEVLHAAMTLSGRHSKPLSHIDVGSFQGIFVRPGRSLYAATKSATIDLYASLVEGSELSRCIYVAPGPIDTYMLHQNHWVTKSGGSAKLLEVLRTADDETYRDILVACSDARLADFCEKHGFPVPVAEFARYKAIRLEVATGSFGILTAEECADVIAEVVTDCDKYTSGIYLLRRKEGKAPSLEFRPFDHVRRSQEFL